MVGLEEELNLRVLVVSIRSESVSLDVHRNSRLKYVLISAISTRLESWPRPSCLGSHLVTLSGEGLVNKTIVQ